MQVKIVITTIAFMLTMIIFGYAALREPARMETFENAYESRQIEAGAIIYHNNCESCHGVNGRAEECYDADGNPDACAGRSLNNFELLCRNAEGESLRMDALGWEGTRHDFVAGTIAAGRPWNGMPTWGSDYGGPLEPYQVENVTLFVQNWETLALCEEEPAPPPEWPNTVEDLSAEYVGDAANGEQLYNVTYGCSACHGDPAVEGSNAVGPWAGDVPNLGGGARAGKDDYTAADYLYESILLPSEYISPECPAGPCAGPPSAMPDNFGTRMSFQDMADVMAYLLNTDTFEGNTLITYPPGSEEVETE